MWWQVLLFIIVPVAGFMVGVWLGRHWGTLPRVVPGASVHFKGSRVGDVRTFTVKQVQHEDRGTTVILSTKGGLSSV